MVVRILKHEPSATSAQDSVRKIIGSSRTLFIFPTYLIHCPSPHHTAHSQPHTPLHCILPLLDTGLVRKCAGDEAGCAVHEAGGGEEDAGGGERRRAAETRSGGLNSKRRPI